MIKTYEECTVRTSVEEDADLLAAHIREADRREVEALTNLPLDMILRQGIKKCDTCFSAFSPEGDLLTIFGVSPHIEDDTIGIVWLLGTHDLYKIHYRFLRESHTWLNKLFGDKYRALTNWVDKRNTLHLRWLDWLGFQALQEQPIGKNQEPFIEVLKLKDV